MMKVLVSDPIAKAGRDLLEENGVEVTYNTELSYEELLEEIGKYHGIMLRSMTPLNEEVLNKADNLEVIARAGSGYDNIDIEAASKRGIVVLNTPGENTVSAAEQAMNLMLASSRNTVQADRSVREGKWERNKYMGVELNQKTLGIIGLGRVGGTVAIRAKSFNMEVIANDPYIPEERGDKFGVELVSKEEIYERCDYITIHTPLTDETHHLLNEETFDKMKEGVRIINAARGGCIDRFALYDAIKEGKVAAAGLDVHEEEPPGEDYNLSELEEVTLAPHLGGTTVAAMDNVAIEAAQQALMVLNDEMPKTPLNIPRIQPEAMAELEPYIKLAEKLGAFYSGWQKERIEEIEVIYEGEITDFDLEPVTKGLLKGILNPILDENVNAVNAEVIAEERGIKTSETKTSASETYSSLIEVKIRSAAGERKLSGTVFHDDELRITEVNGYEVDIDPTGIMLITEHKDQPGIIGETGTILGNNNVNIASMHVGRKKAGGNAVMVMNIDQEIEEEVIEKLLEIDGVFETSVLSL